MKKLLAPIILIVLVLAFQPVFASDGDSSISVEYLSDGSYYETFIEDITESSPLLRAAKTVTKSKTTYYKNSAGDVMWYVKVKGTFTYGDGSAKCISTTPSAIAESSSWKVSNISGTKSGAKASATATGKHYVLGVATNTMTKTVTLTCSSTGVFS